MPIAVPIQFNGQVICQNARHGPAPHNLGHLEQLEIEIEERQVDRDQHERDPEIDEADGAGDVGVHERLDRLQARGLQRHVEQADRPQDLLDRGDAEQDSGEERRRGQQHQHEAVAPAVPGDQICAGPGIDEADQRHRERHDERAAEERQISALT
jgi:hypothetical protein